MHISRFFRIFAVATEMLITLIIHLKKHTIMNKTWKTILKILGYVISFLLTKDKGQKTKKQFVFKNHGKHTV